MPYSDPVLERMRGELRDLRRGIYPFAESSLSGCPALVAAAGAGSTVVAWDALMEIYEAYAAEFDGDIRAYFESAGYWHGGDTLEKRLTSYAKAHSVDQRTARRRSDRGIEQIIRLIYERGREAHPEITIVTTQSGGECFASIVFRAPANSRHLPPEIEVDDEPFGNREPEFYPIEHGRLPFEYLELDFVQAEVEIPRRALRDPGEHKSPLFKLDVRWRVPTWPVRSFGFFTADPRVAGVSVAATSFYTSVSLITTYGADHPLHISDLSELAEHPVVYDEEIRAGMPWPRLDS